MELLVLLQTLAAQSGSDLHLQCGSPPQVRVHGVLRALKLEPLTAADMDVLLRPLLTEARTAEFEKKRSIDIAYPVEGLARFRVNLFHERGARAAVMRIIPTKVPEFEDLNLPSVIEEIAQSERGLVLVAGTTGSGKSSTLAAMIDWQNRHKRRRIITVEDPIEFVHTSDKSLVAQREVGADAAGFHAALREAMRQNPDTILIGELRDQETMATALQAADTGHAVFSTVHTTTASQTVQRLIALFPADERELLVMQLASNLEAVICQRLARTVAGDARVPVIEVLRGTPQVRKLILEGKINSLSQVIAGRDNGMQLFDQHLSELYRADVITGTEAMRLATNPEAVSLAKRGISTSDLSGGLVR